MGILRCSKVKTTIWQRFVDFAKALIGRDTQFISIVLPLRVRRKLDEAMLRKAVESCCGAPLDDMTNFVVVEGPMRLVKVQGHLFKVLNAGRPYIEDAQHSASRLTDGQLKAAILGHQAWLSVDDMDFSNTKLNRNQKYAAVGKVAAEFIDENCLAICGPDEDVMVPVNSASVEVLRKMHSPYELLEVLRESP